MQKPLNITKLEAIRQFLKKYLVFSTIILGKEVFLRDICQVLALQIHFQAILGKKKTSARYLPNVGTSKTFLDLSIFEDICHT